MRNKPTLDLFKIETRAGQSLTTLVIKNIKTETIY